MFRFSISFVILFWWLWFCEHRAHLIRRSEFESPLKFYPLFIKWVTPGLFFTEKTVVFGGIWTQKVGVDGYHADHLTTTTALVLSLINVPIKKWSNWSSFYVQIKSDVIEAHHGIISSCDKTRRGSKYDFNLLISPSWFNSGKLQLLSLPTYFSFFFHFVQIHFSKRSETFASSEVSRIY